MTRGYAHRGGVRIVHADRTLAGKTVVVDTRRPYSQPRACGVCRVWHQSKHLHLQLDGEASRVVTPRILQRLQAVGMAGFTAESQVHRPPRQRLHLGRDMRPSPGQVARIEDALRDLAPAGSRVTITNGSHRE